jgi:hypothetical protein
MLKECVQQLLYDNGLSAGEKFFIVNLKGAKLNGIFYINTNAVKTRDILKCSDDDRDYTYILASLLNGEYLIKAISYYPEQGNEFYFIDIKSEVEFGIITDKPIIAMAKFSTDNLTAVLLRKLGKCYKTRAEAERHFERDWEYLINDDE